MGARTHHPFYRPAAVYGNTVSLGGAQSGTARMCSKGFVRSKLRQTGTVLHDSQSGSNRLRFTSSLTF